MRNKSLPLVAVLTFAASRAFSVDAPPVDEQALLKNLKVIKEKVVADTKLSRTKVIQQLSAAAASDSSAIDFYLDAVRETQFDGRNREQTQFHDWKKKEADKLHSRDLQEAARLHLTYLVLTIQRASGAETKDLLPSLINYTRQVNTAIDSINDQDLMKRPLDNGIFAHWLQLGSLISNARDWEMAPGNLDGIFGKTILPELRKQKDPRVIEYWDLRIQRESANAQQSQRAFDAESFDQRRLPQLLWMRAQDLLAIGKRNQAIAEMYAIIKQYPAHADCTGWIARLEAVLSETASQAAPTE